MFAPLGPDVELRASRVQLRWQLDAAVAFGGFGADGVELTAGARRPDARGVRSPTFAALKAASGHPTEGGCHRVGDRVALDVASAEDVADQERILRVTAELEGQTLSGERRAGGDGRAVARSAGAAQRSSRLSVSSSCRRFATTTGEPILSLRRTFSNESSRSYISDCISWNGSVSSLIWLW